MCGIAGAVSLNGAPVAEEVIAAMTRVIEHRGPDDEGLWVEGGVGLGNRRLAIIDLSPAGHMPMADETGDLVITYNGELYNFRELRRELEGLGHVFRSHTDTEVVLRAYKEWGPRCLERLNGMFGLAIWDGRRRELFLARDRYGVKPVYYTQVGDELLFGSEIKSFLQHPRFRVEVSLPHLLEYFTFQNVFSDGTLFAGVKLLQPGHYLVVSPDRPIPEPVRYWDFEFVEEDAGVSDAEYLEELDRLFEQAVERQLVSD